MSLKEEKTVENLLKQWITKQGLVFFVFLCNIRNIMSVTYQPKVGKRKRKHGFLVRQATTAGRNVIRNRRRKGRAKLSV